MKEVVARNSKFVVGNFSETRLTVITKNRYSSGPISGKNMESPVLPRE